MGIRLAFLLLLISSPALASEAQKARVMWSAFECSTFAEVKKDTAEQARLFQLGYRQGKQFLEAMEAGKITPEEMRKNVPVIVALLLAGPSIDFHIRAGIRTGGAVRQGED